MPKLGERKRAKEIGKTGGNYYEWCACIDCGKERWVFLGEDGVKAERCFLCSHRTPQAREVSRKRIGSKNFNWGGGRHIDPHGYIMVKISPNDFFYPMARRNGYVSEHRLVVAKALGRNLHKWEIVHHKGERYLLSSIENRQDNRYPENLELIGATNKHSRLVEAVLKKQAVEIGDLQQRVILLEAENILLKEQIMEPARCVW